MNEVTPNMAIRALVVDDSLTVRMDMAEVLESAGFAVTTAADIAEAKSQLHGQVFHLIVLDVLLPDGDGLELLGTIRANPEFQDSAIITLSAESSLARRTRAYELGADAFIAKPYERAVLKRHALEMVHSMSGGGSTVLVIDDSISFAQQLKESLEDVGFSVLLADTGETGLRIARRVRPEVIIVDRMLPGIDGTTVLRRIRLDPRIGNTLCLMMTGVEEGASEIPGLAAGADMYLPKSETFDLVHARLNALLRARQEDLVQLSGQLESTLPNAHVLAPDERRLKILAVDDSPTFLGALDDEMGERYDLITAKSGQEAVELSSKNAFDVILLDVHMPGMSGIEVCRQIRSGQAGLVETPIIMLTAHSSKDDVVAGLNAGADDYVSKSDDFAILQGRLDAQLRRRQLELVRLGRRESRLRDALARSQADSARSRVNYQKDLERKNAELEIANARAEEISRTKSEFVANISHESRNALSVIIGISDLILQNKLAADLQIGVESIRTAGESLLALVNEVLDLSKIEEGRVELDLQPMPLFSLLADALDMQMAKAESKHLELMLTIAPDVPHAVLGDAAAFKQIMSNLLGNAIKFTDGGHVKTDVAWLRTGDSGRLEIQVSDTGPGIDAADLPNFFQRYAARASKKINEQAGSGLGLAITKQLVELMGGTITVKSEPGLGSCFTVSIPLSPVNFVDTAAASTFELPAGLSVLIVTPDEDFGIFISQLCVEIACVPSTVGNMTAALKRLKQDPVEGQAIQIVLLDDAMQDATDVKLAQRMHKDKRLAHTPLIRLTSPSNWSDLATARQCGFGACLAKPVYSHTLQGALSVSLNNKHEPTAQLISREYINRSQNAITTSTIQAAKRILIVEDNRENADLLQQMLKLIECDSSIARNGQIAVEACAKEEFSLIFMDWQMPVMNGLEATRAIRAMEKPGQHTPIIALTAQAIGHGREQCLEAGMDDYYVKPIRPDTIKGILQRHL